MPLENGSIEMLLILNKWSLFKESELLCAMHGVKAVSWRSVCHCEIITELQFDMKQSQNRNNSDTGNQQEHVVHVLEKKNNNIHDDHIKRKSKDLNEDKKMLMLLCFSDPEISFMSFSCKCLASVSAPHSLLYTTCSAPTTDRRSCWTQWKLQRQIFPSGSRGDQKQDKRQWILDSL